MEPQAVLAELDGLRALARSLVCGDADDLLQDAALAAIEHPPVADERPVGGWLRSVVLNRWRMDRRSARRRRAREQAASEREVDAAPEAPGEAIDRARALESLAAALVALDEPFRTTVIRRYLDGESAAQIAQALGIPAGTVRWRLKTGLARLRAQLDDRSPRWPRVLAPLAGVTVKAKTSFAFVILVVLLLGLAGVLWFVLGPDRPDPAPAQPILTAVDPAPPPAPPPSAVHDPPPGQARAVAADSDAVGGVIAGRVIDAMTGDGVAGAEVVFAGGGGVVAVRSGDDGGFEVAPAAPGRFVLAAVTAPGFLPNAPELGNAPMHATLVKGRDVRGLTLLLMPAIDYQGKVVDAAGAPAAGAHIQLVGVAPGDQLADALQTAWVADAAGRFTFRVGRGAVLEATRGSKRGWARLQRDAAYRRELTIRLGDAPPLTATITGVVRDETNAPVAGALLRAATTAVTVTNQPVMFVTTGDDGTFALTGLDRGAYDLVVETDDHAPAIVPGVAGGTQHVTITLDAGLALAGQVVEPSGKPSPAFTVLVVRRNGLVRRRVVARWVVDPRGRFTVRVAPGDYEVSASAIGWATSPAVTAAAGTTDLRLAVTAGSTLAGVVLSSEDHAPIGFAQIVRDTIGPGVQLPGTTSRADGTFELTGLSPGAVAIRIFADGYHPKIEAGLTAIDGGALGPIRIELTPATGDAPPSMDVVGIGVQLGPDGDALRVARVLPGGGGEAAGMQAGDQVTRIDATPVATLGIEQAIHRIRGAVGTSVAITVQRDGKTLELVVMRRKLVN